MVLSLQRWCGYFRPPLSSSSFWPSSCVRRLLHERRINDRLITHADRLKCSPRIVPHLLRAGALQALVVKMASVVFILWWWAKRQEHHKSAMEIAFSVVLGAFRLRDPEGHC